MTGVAPATILTEGLTKSYGPVRAVTDLDLEVREGEIYGFLGPNGAGKTTTLRLLLDFIRPDRGRASLFGKDVRRERAEIHRHVGYLPGELAFWPELSGRENIVYLARLRGGVDEPYLTDLADRLDIDVDRPFRAYSHGNKQKIGLIQAFLHRPRLLLLDEPTTGLDPLVQQTFYALLEEVRGRGATVFVSSHILSEVERICDRVGIIRDGALVRVAGIPELQAGTRHRLRLVFQGAVEADAFASVPGVAGVEQEAHSAEETILTMTLVGDPKPVLAAAARYPLLTFESRRPSLEELFFALYGDGAPGEG